MGEIEQVRGVLDKVDAYLNLALEWLKDAPGDGWVTTTFGARFWLLAAWSSEFRDEHPWRSSTNSEMS